MVSFKLNLNSITILIGFVSRLVGDALQSGMSFTKSVTLIQSGEALHILIHKVYKTTSLETSINICRCYSDFGNIKITFHTCRRKQWLLLFAL